jgi:hypothetical protein
MPKIEQIAYIVGMPRAGTTFLYHNLQKHPQIYVPFRRKSNYFSLHYEKSIDWFLEHFKDIKPDQVGIDTETLFFADKTLNSCENILKLNPDAKAMVFVREPSEWVWSVYKQITTFDKNVMPFDDFLAGKYVLTEDGKKLQFNMGEGDIESAIEMLMKTFKGNLLIVDFKLFNKNPLLILQEIEKFIGIPSFFTEKNFDNKRINASERRHSVFLVSLLRKPWLINALNRIPRNIVVFIRRVYDSFGSMAVKKPKDNIHCDDEVLLAKKIYSRDQNYIDKIFADSQILKR